MSKLKSILLHFLSFIGMEKSALFRLIAEIGRSGPLLKQIEELERENFFYRSRYLFLENKIAHLTNELINKGDLRIIIGSSGVYQENWTPLDQEQLDLLEEKDWERVFGNRYVDAFLAEHVWEHLSVDDGLYALKKCYDVLKKGGYIRIAVPDGYHNEQNYVEAVKPGGTGEGSDTHKVLYNVDSLSDLLKKAGFRKIIALEYFDREGLFHKNSWLPEQGMIHRSIQFDDRNANGKPNFTSLIIDAYKS